jgi:DNA-binding response OmpR family regulator
MIDLHLTDRNGLDVIRTLRREKNFGEIPIIAMNARGVSGDRQRSIEAGANEYMSKPIILEKLDAILQVWLNS